MSQIHRDDFATLLFFNLQKYRESESFNCINN